MRYINQRASGPVNAKLTPGPGIYFNAFKQMLMSTESPYHLAHLLQV